MKPKPRKDATDGRSDCSPPGALLVMADAVPRALCRDALEAQGFSVAFADTGVAAVLSARKDPPELVLVDMELSDGPGLEAVGWLRCNPALKSAPIILFSANPQRHSGKTRMGADAVLRMPTSPMAIADALRKILKRLLKRPCAGPRR